MRLSRVACISGAVLLTAGLMLSSINLPVRAQVEMPETLETGETPASTESVVEIPPAEEGSAPTAEETPVPTEEIITPVEETLIPAEEMQTPTEELFATLEGTLTPTEALIDTGQAEENTELSLVCVSMLEDGTLAATLSDGSQLPVVDGLVEGTQIVVGENTPVCDSLIPDLSQAVRAVSYTVTGSATTMCAAIPYDIHADFEVVVEGLPEGYEGLELYVMDPYGNVMVYPLAYDGGTVIVNDTWPGITDIHSVIWMGWSAYLYDNGSQVADGVASVSYDPNLGDIQRCTEALSMAQPMGEPGGDDYLVWYALNTNPWAAEYQWFMDGDLVGSGLIPPATGSEPGTCFLGRSQVRGYNSELVWVGVEGMGAVLAAGEGLICASEEAAPQQPEQSFIPPAESEPALETPQEEGLPILIPVTGVDATSLPVACNLFGRLLMSLGLLVGGMGLILLGWSRALTEN